MTNDVKTYGPLAGMRILDVSQLMAGPICTMRLADLGAEVIKVEPPHGDWTRTHGFANAEINGETTAVLGLNRNKKSVVINLKTDAGREALYRLAAKCDAFVQNFRVGVTAKLKIAYEDLKAINPRLIYCSISGYGQEGPYRLRPGQDLLLQGLSGSMFSVGSKDDLPTPGALFAVDAMSGYNAAIGILSAFIARQQTGVGQHIDVSMLGVVMDCQIQELVTHLNLGKLPQRTGATMAHAWCNAPYAVYRTSDGFLVISMSPIHVLGKAIKNDRLQEMVEWNDGETYRDEIYDIVKAVLPSKTTAQWIQIFDEFGLWSGPVYSYRDLASDPHVKATHMITHVEHPTAGELKMPDNPVRMSDTPGAIRLPPPLLGEHSEEILSEIAGYTKDEFNQLCATGVTLQRGHS